MYETGAMEVLQTLSCPVQLLSKISEGGGRESEVVYQSLGGPVTSADKKLCRRANLGNANENSVQSNTLKARSNVNCKTTR